VRGHGTHSDQKKLQEIAPGGGIPSKDAKTCFVFFLSPIQRGLSATYPAPILSIFLNKRRELVSACINHLKLPNFHTGFYRSQKQLKMGTFEGVCDWGTAQTAQFRAMGIISGTAIVVFP